MAITSTPKSKALAIEVQTGADKAGDPTYAKKTFSGVKLTAADQNVYNVAESIKAVLSESTNRTFINEVDTLANA